MPDEFIRPDADTALDGWTDEAGGTTTIYTKIDESSAGDSDFVQSPVIEASQADLHVRLIEGASTEIAEWTHSDVSETFATAEQTLTTPEFESITDFTDLFIELDDNAGSVYRFSLGDPVGTLTEPVVVRYRYKKLVVEEEEYEGPGDIVSGATYWGGLRAYNTAYATGSNPAIDIVKASDGSAEMTINILADGSLDVATIAALGYAVKVKKMWDQTGNGNHLANGSLSLMPALTLNAIGSLPGITFDRTADTGLGNSSFPSTSQPWTASTVAKRVGNFSDRNCMLTVGSFGIYLEPSTQEFLVYGGNINPVSGATNNTWLALQGVANGASSIGSVNGASTTVDAGTNGLTSGNLRWGDNATNGLNGLMTEFGVWPVAFTSGNNTAMSANQRAYWGF